MSDAQQQNLLDPNFDDYQEKLKQIGATITNSNFEKLQTYFQHEQQFDAFRSIIFSKLLSIAKPITQNSTEWQEMNVEEQHKLLFEIQEMIYDLQLIESASNFHVFGIANSIFALNKKRCSKKVIKPKPKVQKKKKQDLSLINIREIRRAERDRESPNLSKLANELNAGSPLPNKISQNEETTSNAKKTTFKRKSKVALKATGKTSEVGDAASIAKAVEMSLAENNLANQATASTSKICETKTEPEDVKTSEKVIVFLYILNQIKIDSPTLTFNELPKKRAAALAAAVSVTETVISSQRSSSPRKRTMASANNNIDDDDDDSSQDINPDEQTYCLCHQISFGKHFVILMPLFLGEMICCDFAKCPIEWFHFSCVNIKIKPKKKWYCPLCRGEKPSILKATLQSKK